ncbi:NAD(P)-binding domain-containing protein [Sneathiella sp. P13V-1]|uniref:flavin-containing monooxygenase n=1 Tax=Sneathiella sp. P13V-1 TaxID=2697366 RepID=UPI00187B1278|nr:NAD(P)/FAD-dependent oxidoreductase [Sneathiella sp. P13V-1]MBE7637081.1 NAD(P)-binding domain-containing protein [Sneathiella sp. P13V-1]
MTAPSDDLQKLQETIEKELHYLNQPAKNWVKPAFDKAGNKMLDVAIIGGGATGIALAHALKREGVRNFKVYDKSPEGREGPWITTARMETLRSPKHLTGPNLGMPNLTFRAWHDAKYGSDAWEPLGKIPKEIWMAYLVWYRMVLGIRVQNDHSLNSITPKDGAYHLQFQNGVEAIARHVVLATGRAASGGVSLPQEAEAISEPYRAHTEDLIDYPSLEGKDILVIGGAASAVDAAATALEAGAAKVTMLIRAPEMPTINKFKNIVYPGFLSGFYKLPDAEKWAFMKAGFDARIAPPRDSMLRLKVFDNFNLKLGTSVQEFVQKEQKVIAKTSKGEFTADFVIFGTGYAMNMAAQDELKPFADDICLWRDIYTPPEDLTDATLASYPYLGDAFQFLAKPGRKADYLSRLYMFNAAATLTHAPISSDIPGTNTGVQRLSQHLIEQLFVEGSGGHLQDLKDYDEPELLGDEWDE